MITTMGDQFAELSPRHELPDRLRDPEAPVRGISPCSFTTDSFAVSSETRYALT